MEKIVFKDGTELLSEIDQGLERISLRITGKTLTEVEKILTPENITRLELQTEEGEVYGVYKNLSVFAITKYLKGELVGNIEAVLIKENKTEVRLAALEEGQAIQDGAIMELAEMAGGAE